ncbi:MAG: GTP 3',8-cyclase MoaA [Lachnospiraceae bacterium]|nr:GTP 3',8-cyclase MoaA [Lachnospiraceae bacterium]
MKDSYGREITYLRLSVTERCNLRCRYCMPEEGICKKMHEEMLTEDEMIMAVRAAASLGIRKLRITGGEPMVKRNLLSICERAAKVPGIQEVCMTTNATLLADAAGQWENAENGVNDRSAGQGDQSTAMRRIPRNIAQAIRQAGVNRLNISLDTLDPQKYAWITRRGTLESAQKGIHAALEAGFDKIKINTVLLGGFNDDEVPELAALTKTYPVDLRFIELMPMSGDEEFGPKAYIPVQKVLEMLPSLVPFTDKAVQVQKMPHEGVATMYHFPGAPGRIGLISPLQQHFCAECNRIRVTADGIIKPCLHSLEEYSLKGLDEEGMRRMLEKAILAKPQWHGTLSYEERSHSARPMNRIGG